MLRISESSEAEEATLKAEGRLAGPWVHELRRAAESWLGRGLRVCLDISGLTYADSDGVALLRDLRLREVRLCGASRFMAELLEGGRW
jgi:ABC-type transporter Mla MlaB component